MSQAPTVSELDALKLETALLRAENVQLQIVNLQMALQKYRDEYQTLCNGIAVEGHALQRLPDGAWVYQPVPPTKEAR